MADFIKTPVKGMRDCLPADSALRRRVMDTIRDTYARYGFSEIETPCLEHIENLTGKQGGENEKLIFKVLKRGRELDRAVDALVADAGAAEAAGTEGASRPDPETVGALSDTALRYDLTVPLSRYCACHANDLPVPFKALQIGNVWRADNPQKGRFRQFTQCDIDIVGDASIMAEIELIGATSEALTRILEPAGVTGITIHVNDRAILKAMAAWAGFEAADFDAVFIILDKLDKIGLDGVTSELLAAGYAEDAVRKYVGIFAETAGEADGTGATGGAGGADSVAAFCSFLPAEVLDGQVARNLDTILSCARAVAPASASIVFDPTLVRGMSYYTGPIFECTIDGAGSSVAGGGRYDEMIGRFSGTDMCACGFSIGFERIVGILAEHEERSAAGDSGAEGPAKCALLVEKGASDARMMEAFAEAARLRESGAVVSVQQLRKNAKRQIAQLEDAGYTDIRKIYR